MFPLGHVGFTVAAWRLTRGRWDPGPRGLVPWVAVGAILPDLVDKPVGMALLDMGTGRLVGHTPAFVLALAGIGWVLARRGRRLAGARAGALAFASGAHLVLDRVFLDPHLLLWPLLGVGFPAQGFEAARWWTILLTDPWTYVPEVLGGAYLAWEGLRWARTREAASVAP